MAQRRVKWQKANPRLGSEIDETGYGEISGDKDAYQKWADHNIEPLEANPDRLTEDASQWNVGNTDCSEEAEIMDAAYYTLTDKQKQVWDLVMREGCTEEEAADHLDISRRTVNQHKEAAIRKVKTYCYNHGKHLMGGNHGADRGA